MTTKTNQNNPLITSSKNAFTLAETLITLGIIGVVAALTLPTLTQNYRKHVVETKLAKFYTTINQAVRISSAENGEPADWVKDCGSSGSPTCSVDDFTDWFKTYIGKYMNYSNIEPDQNNKAVWIYFNDGSILYWETCIYDMRFYISQKAITTKKDGINAFQFRFMPKMPAWGAGNASYIKANQYAIKRTVEPFVYNWDGTIEQLYSGTTNSCDGTYASYCAKLIQVNGWKIPKDYPLKF